MPDARWDSTQTEFKCTGSPDEVDTSAESATILQRKLLVATWKTSGHNSQKTLYIRVISGVNS